MRTLLLDPKFNACNVADIKGSKLLVDTLCRTSRLPRENSVEALELQPAGLQGLARTAVEAEAKRVARVTVLACGRSPKRQPLPLDAVAHVELEGQRRALGRCDARARRRVVVSQCTLTR